MKKQDIVSATAGDVHSVSHTAKAPFASESLRSRFKQGVTWNIVGAVSTQGSTFLANVIIANLLGRGAFGEFSMVYSTLVALAGIAQMYTGIAATKYVAEFRSVDRERTGRILGLCSATTFIGGIVAGAILALIAPWLAANVLNAPSLGLPLALGSVFVVFSAVNGFQVGALAGLESYQAIARIGIAQGVFHVSVTTAMAYIWGLEGAVVGLVASNVLRWVLFERAVRREAIRQGIKIHVRGAWKERRVLEQFIVPAALAGLWGLPALWLANAILVRQPGGYDQMGLFAAANNLRALILFLPSLLNNVGTSLINNQLGIGDQRCYRAVFWANAGAIAGAVVVGAAVVAVMGPWLLGLYGPGFTDARPALLLLAASTFFEGLALAGYQVLGSKEKIWLSLLIALPRDGLLVLSAFFLTTSFGASGLAAAYLIAWIFGCIAVYGAVLSIGLDIDKGAVVKGV